MLFTAFCDMQRSENIKGTSFSSGSDQNFLSLWTQISAEYPFLIQIYL